AIMVLTPDVGREKIVEGCNGGTPWNVSTRLQPLGVLIKHRVHDMDERLVRGEQPMAAGEEIAFQPSLTGVLAQHLHNPSIGSQVIILGTGLSHPGPVGDLKESAEPVRCQFVWCHHSKIPVLKIACHHVPKKVSQNSSRFHCHDSWFQDLDGIVSEWRYIQGSQ